MELDFSLSWNDTMVTKQAGRTDVAQYSHSRRDLPCISVPLDSKNRRNAASPPDCYVVIIVELNECFYKTFTSKDVSCCPPLPLPWYYSSPERTDQTLTVELWAVVSSLSRDATAAERCLDEFLFPQHSPHTLTSV